VRWLTENGLQAQGFKTEYGDEDVADGVQQAVGSPGGDNGGGPLPGPSGLPPEGGGGDAGDLVATPSPSGGGPGWGQGGEAPTA